MPLKESKRGKLISNNKTANMQFGKVPVTEQMNLNLPDDFNGGMRFQPSSPLNLYVGGTVMFPKAWKNTLYPKGTKAQDAMRAYAEHFNTIELNATHYKIYPPEHMAKWAAQVPDCFRFCPKVPQLISHFRRLKNCEHATDDFLAGLMALGPTLGPVFLQMPPNFTPKHIQTLMDWVKQWPRDVPLALELRHPGWFQDSKLLVDLVDFLTAHHIGFVITDTPGRRDVLHMALTAPFLVLRFLGSELHPSDRTRLADWSERLDQWHQRGLQEVYLLIHQPDSVLTPKTRDLFQEIRFGRG
jgi:uncharacterized protein YecE (DUF72 family)